MRPTGPTGRASDVKPTKRTTVLLVGRGSDSESLEEGWRHLLGHPSAEARIVVVNPAEQGAWQAAVEALEPGVVLMASMESSPGPDLLMRMLTAHQAHPEAVIDARVLPVEVRRLGAASAPDH